MKLYYSYQKGRSMIELLAVLIVIGMLTVASLSGIRYILDKIKAGQIMNEALITASELQNRRYVKYDGDNVAYPYGKYISKRVYENDSNKVLLLTAENVSKGVCQNLVMTTGGSNREFESILVDNSTTVCGADNAVVFKTFPEYAKQGGSQACQLTNADCTAGGGVLKKANFADCYCECPEGQNWKGDECVCSDAMLAAGVDPDTCACPDNQFINPATGKCEPCASPRALRWTGATYVCSCPTLYDSNGHAQDMLWDGTKCQCPETGFVEVGGICLKSVCSGGTPGTLSYKCQINDKTCGVNCDEKGVSCQYGVCNPKNCEAGHPLEYTTVHANTYYYGCSGYQWTDGSQCWRYLAVNDDKYYCANNEAGCMELSSDASRISYGMCDKNECTSIQAGADLAYFEFNGHCLFTTDAGSMTCTINTGLWSCSRNGYACGWNCTKDQVKATIEGASSGTCGSCATQACLKGFTYVANMYNPSTGTTEAACQKDNYWCATKTEGYYEPCYWTDSGEQCGGISKSAPKFTRASCDPADCPAGTTFAKVLTGQWGCFDPSSTVGCVVNGTGYGPFICYYKQIDADGNTKMKSCGELCSYTNGKWTCNSVKASLCSADGNTCPQTGYDMSDGCTCTGEITNLDGVNYCCAPGHRYVNGGCNQY